MIAFKLVLEKLYSQYLIKTCEKTRMHSSRIHTVRCSGCRRGGERGVSQHALGRGDGVCIPACTGQGVCITACTGRGVYPSMHWTEGCLQRGESEQGGVYPGGVSAGGCLPWRCLPRGVSVPVHAGTYPV